MCSLSRSPGRLARAALLLALLAAPAASAVELVLSGMTYVGSDAGEPELVLAAREARIAHDGDVAHLAGVRLDAAGDDGASSLVLTCDRAQLDLGTSDFTAQGHVLGRTGDGHTFRTEAASFDHAHRVLEGNAPVDIVDPSGTRLQGQGFRYEVRSQRMRMRNAVVSELTEEPIE
jgi:LPS export ABC transporter protein LptC